MVIHLGKGGFGDVYQCGDKAVKIIRHLRNGFWCYNEICISQCLNHPNIIAPETVYIKDDKVHIVMDKADTDLRKWRSENVPSSAQILRWIVQILSALAFMHRQEVLHCDIKASNILLFGDTVKIADFSLSRRIGHRSKFHVCTHCHRPPEYWTDSPPDPGYWVDIWALGYTLYYLIRGKSIFPAYKSPNKEDRQEHYHRMYVNYAKDYRNLSSSALGGDLLHQLTVLMLNPEYTARPTAESLLTLISLKTGSPVCVDPTIISTKPGIGSEIHSCLDKILHKISITPEPEIVRLSHQIIKTVTGLIELNPDLYIATSLWMASKIVLDRAYDPKVLGLSTSSILSAELTICNMSSFKFCII